MEATIKVNSQALANLIETCAAVSDNLASYLKEPGDLEHTDLENIVSELLRCAAIVSATAIKS